MGVLNLTPDSFASAGSLSAAAALDVALAMESEGADILDIGGESTRPGAAVVDEAEERARVLPVLEKIAGRLRIPISVDTYKAAIASAAVDAGASIINDVSGLTYEPGLGAVAARTGAALILMHMRGRPDTMYAEAHYDDVCGEVTEELRRAIDRAVEAGVSRQSLIVDPGIGFAKRPAHSYGVLAGAGVMSDLLGRPVLVGPSRKSFMAEALAQRPVLERDWGTAAAVTAAVLAGVHIVRVHAVAEMVQVVRVAEQIRHYTPRRGR